MAQRRRRRKCLNCRYLFRPDPRNVNKQRYCSKPDCRKAGKAAAQKRWLGKKKNKDYFKGEVHVARVQEWRKQNPGYWNRCQNALQDHLKVQHAVIIGLISHLTGTALQDHIVSTVTSMQQLGQDILNSSPYIQGGDYAAKANHQPRPDT
jgi:hypothetical protein